MCVCFPLLIKTPKLGILAVYKHNVCWEKDYSENKNKSKSKSKKGGKRVIFFFFYGPKERGLFIETLFCCSPFCL